MPGLTQYLPQQFWGGFTGIQPGLTNLATGIADRFSPNAREARAIMDDPYYWWDPNTQSYKEGAPTSVTEKYGEPVTNPQNPNEYYFPGHTPTPGWAGAQPQQAQQINLAEAILPLMLQAQGNYGMFGPQLMNTPRGFPTTFGPTMGAGAGGGGNAMQYFSQRRGGGPVEGRMNPQLDAILRMIGIERSMGEVPIRAHEGEYVMNKDAVKAMGPNTLDRINRQARTGNLPKKAAMGFAPKMQEGGLVVDPEEYPYSAFRSNQRHFQAALNGQLGESTKRQAEAYRDYLSSKATASPQNNMTNQQEGRMVEEEIPDVPPAVTEKRAREELARQAATAAMNAATGSDPMEAHYGPMVANYPDYTTNTQQEQQQRMAGDNALSMVPTTPGQSRANMLQDENAMRMLANQGSFRGAGATRNIPAPYDQIAWWRSYLNGLGSAPVQPQQPQAQPQAQPQQAAGASATPVPSQATMQQLPQPQQQQGQQGQQIGFRAYNQPMDIDWGSLYNMPFSQAMMVLQQWANTQGSQFQPKFGPNNTAQPTPTATPQQETFNNLLNQYGAGSQIQSGMLGNVGQSLQNYFYPAQQQADLEGARAQTEQQQLETSWYETNQSVINNYTKALTTGAIQAPGSVNVNMSPQDRLDVISGLVDNAAVNMRAIWDKIKSTRDPKEEDLKEFYKQYIYIQYLRDPMMVPTQPPSMKRRGDSILTEDELAQVHAAAVAERNAALGGTLGSLEDILKKYGIDPNDMGTDNNE